MRISDWSSDVCSSDLTVTFELARSLGLDRPGGVLINAVSRGGPADRAGLKAGDVVLTVDGREVNDPRAGRKRVGYGKSVSVRVDLGGRRILKKIKYRE